MEQIDENFQLNFIINSKTKIIVDEKLLDKLLRSDYSSFPKDTDITKIYSLYFEIKFKDGGNLMIYSLPVECNIMISKTNRVINLYSFKHLKLILENLKDDYKNPYFYSNFKQKDIFINDSKLKETDFYYESSIEIRNKDENEYKEMIEKIFNDMNNILLSKKGNYDFISPNFKIYFPTIDQDELSKKFTFINSQDRRVLQTDFKKFLDNNSIMIYPICGPHNIGKTITALDIQKVHYSEEIKSLYINLKYYFHNPSEDFNQKIDVLIRECFYFIENAQELLKLYNSLKKIDKLDDIFSILLDYFNQKKWKQNQFFLIIDQYQTKYDSNNILDTFSSFKIFLISSINDSDVKKNLVLSYQEKALKKYALSEKIEVKKILRYTYYEYLLDFRKFNSIMIESKIKDKIQKIEDGIDNEELNKKIKFISSILEKFNFIPKYSFKYIYDYDTIYDLMFNEYKHIFFKLLQFESNKIIDTKAINKLLGNNYIIEKNEVNHKTLPEGSYIEYLKCIPLKYINFHLNEKGELYFYYSFPLFKILLNNFCDYSESRDNFFSTRGGSEKGIYFEKLVVYQLRIYNSLGIDGHLKVDKIINMNLTENFKLLDKNYIQGKKNILITQEQREGKIYDFAIYQPEENKLILFQSKYHIEHNLIKSKNSYKESSQTTLINFQNEFNNNDITDVYLLYVSSEEYNVTKKITVKNLLVKNQINCLFYSVRDKKFSFNFKDEIKDLKCEDSFMLLSKTHKYQIKDFKQEKLIKKPEENQRILLNKKIKKIYDNEKIRNTLQEYFSKQKIEFSLGTINEINGFYEEKLKYVTNKEYIVIFALKEEDDSLVDLSKPIGLIYSDKGKEIYFEVTKKQNYLKYEELFMNFTTHCYYGVGEK